MTDSVSTKPWFMSKTIAAALIALLLAIVQAAQTGLTLNTWEAVLFTVAILSLRTLQGDLTS